MNETSICSPRDGVPQVWAGPSPCLEVIAVFLAESGLPLASGCAIAGCTLRYCKACFAGKVKGFGLNPQTRNWLGSSSLLFPAARHYKMPIISLVETQDITGDS